MSRSFLQKLLLVSRAFLLSGIAPVFAEEDELEILRLMGKPQ